MDRLEDIHDKAKQAPDALEEAIGWASSGIGEYCIGDEPEEVWDKVKPDMLAALVEEDLPYLLETIEHLQRENERLGRVCDSYAERLAMRPRRDSNQSD